MKKEIFIIMVALMVLGLTASLANAWVPPLINYQGVLTDSVGNRLTGTYRMTFSIYNDSIGGTQLWSELQESVACSCGIFNVTLGSVDSIPLQVFRKHNRWLGVKVGDDPEMTPRRRFTSVGFAYKADYTGISYKCYPESFVEIPIPHFVPFQILTSELYETSTHSAWISGGTNDYQLSYVGIDGSGNIVHGNVWLGSIDTILTVCPGLVLRTKGDFNETLVLESSASNKLGRALLIAPHDRSWDEPWVKE